MTKSFNQTPTGGRLSSQDLKIYGPVINDQPVFSKQNQVNLNQRADQLAEQKIHKGKPVEPADVISLIEAFGVSIPENFVQALYRRFSLTPPGEGSIGSESEKR